MFLCHGPFKGLCKCIKKLLLTLRKIEWLQAESTARSQSQKNLITQRNLKQNQKYFKPLLSGPGSLKLWKKQDKNLVVLSLKKDKEKSHDSAQYDTARNLAPRSGKTRISQRKQNQKGKYFHPLVSGPGRFEWWVQSVHVNRVVGPKDFGFGSRSGLILKFCLTLKLQ